MIIRFSSDVQHPRHIFRICLIQTVIEEAKPADHGSTKLLETYRSVKVTMDMEMTYWYNRVWQENAGEITVIRRAKALAAAYSRSTPTVQPYELLGGQKSKHMRGAFPYPWICGSFFNAQADALMKGLDKPPLSATDEISMIGDAIGSGNVTKDYGNIISIGKKFGARRELIAPLVKVAKDWDGVSVEDLANKYTDMTPDAKRFHDLMDSSICLFDSFAIPQGREVMNYWIGLQYGFDGIIQLCDEKIRETMGEAGGNGLIGMKRGYYYVAMKIIAEGMSKWCENYAARAGFLAEYEKNPEIKACYEKVADIMSKVAHRAPQTFHEALNMTLVCHLGVVNEDPMSGMSVGRIGQVLQPYYEKDIREGVTTDEEVIKLLERYRVKISCIECFASSGVTGGVLSGNTFNNLSLGGQDMYGQSAVTDLEYLILEAGARCKCPQPTLSVLWDEKLPEDFMLKAAALTKTGVGYPAYMNFQTGRDFLLHEYADEGMTLADARAWANGGCMETAPCTWMPLEYDGKVTMIPGGASPTCANGVHFIALPKVLELATDCINKANNLQMDIWERHCPPIVASLTKANCFEKGATISDMGAKYNGGMNWESTGTINLINSFASIYKNVYDDKKYTIEEMTDGMLHNFGYKTAWETGNFAWDHHEPTENTPKYAELYADCLNAPKYGNNDKYVDRFLKDYEFKMYDLVHKFHGHKGYPLYLCQIAVTCQGPLGFITYAGADGRMAGSTYTDGAASATPNTDKNGIYALFESATCYNHSMHQNAQMNLKLHPSVVSGPNGTRKMLDIINAYMRKGGFHIQYNIVDSNVLRDAKVHPENYKDLMVRVAGFTQYWCELNTAIMDEVIERTEHTA